MSLELVRLSLSMDTEITPTDKATKNSPSSRHNTSEITNRAKLKKKKLQLQKQKQKIDIEKKKRKKIKSAIEKYKEDCVYDNTEANVKALLKITKLGKVQNDVAEKILFKQPCLLSRDRKQTITQPLTSVFTEEDFQKFETEYQAK
ncbi:active regulator of SIRT1-like [Physella acuta]|uniref:active regulator of SIRT1-like n=1 Tax=Physella acuta TaxID=109671 RepID=UPI0027DCD514|nr:active regulator of SIRT1-like [Physella acuta]